MLARGSFVPVFLGLSLAMLVVWPSAARPAQPPLAVGWHDELNEPAAWLPLGSGRAPDAFAAQAGALTLRLPPTPSGFPYDYQWGGVSRPASVDLGKYPVLVAMVSRVGEGSYAHLDVEERDAEGQPGRTLRTPTLHRAGLTVLDVGEAWGAHPQRLYLRLIVGGQLSGASCEYAWVRFVRREDVARLRAKPHGSTPILDP